MDPPLPNMRPTASDNAPQNVPTRGPDARGPLKRARSMRSQATKGRSDKEMISRYQGKFLSHKIDLVVERVEGYDLATARKLADFSNLCYYDAHQVALTKKDRLEAITGQPIRSVKIMKTLDDILAKDNELQWCSYTTTLSVGQVIGNTLKMSGGGKAQTDTQWLYALSPDVMVVAFRGTEGTKMKDILCDLNARKVHDPNLCPRAKRGRVPARGKARAVHAGFKNALDDVWDDFLAAVEELGWGCGREVYLTGHSLGGALATLAAARLELGRFYNEWRERQLHREGGSKAAVEGDVQPASMGVRGDEDDFVDDELVYRPAIGGLYTFGAPRVFNIKVARKFDDFAKPRHWRFVNNNDVVPRVPLAFMGFRHAGHHMYVTCDMVIERDPSDGVIIADGLRGRVKNGLMKADLLLDSMTDHSITEYCAALNKNMAELAEGGPRRLEDDFNADLLRYMPKFKSMRNFRDENYFDLIETAHESAKAAARVVVQQMEAQGPTRLEVLLAPDELVKEMLEAVPSHRGGRQPTRSRSHSPAVSRLGGTKVAEGRTASGAKVVVEGGGDDTKGAAGRAGRMAEMAAGAAKLESGSLGAPDGGTGMGSQRVPTGSGRGVMGDSTADSVSSPCGVEDGNLGNTVAAAGVRPGRRTAGGPAVALLSLDEMKDVLRSLPSNVPFATQLDPGDTAGPDGVQAHDAMSVGAGEPYSSTNSRRWAVDLAKAIHALLTPGEEVHVVVESTRLEVSVPRRETSLPTSHGVSSMPGVIFVATNMRLIILRIRPASWASICELGREHRPMGSLLSHQVDYTIDKGLLYSSVLYSNFTGVQMNSSLKVSTTTVVSAQLSFWAVALVAFLGMYVLSGVTLHAFTPQVAPLSTNSSTPTVQNLVAMVSLVGYWKMALMLVVVIYVAFYSAPRFCYNLSTSRPRTATANAFTVTLGYKDPITQEHCVGTVHLSPQTDPSVILHFVRGIEKQIHAETRISQGAEVRPPFNS